MVDRLLKIALTVEQADADETQAEVARAFGVIARQHAQTAGGNGQRLVKCKLGREIRHRIRAESGSMEMAPRLGVAQVGVEIAEHPSDARGKGGVHEADLEFVTREFVQDGDGVMIEILPAPRGEFAEEVLGFLIPAPPEVAGQAQQARGKVNKIVRGCRSRCHGVVVFNWARRARAFKTRETLARTPGVGNPFSPESSRTAAGQGDAFMTWTRPGIRVVQRAARR